MDIPIWNLSVIHLPNIRGQIQQIPDGTIKCSPLSELLRELGSFLTKKMRMPLLNIRISPIVVGSVIGGRDRCYHHSTWHRVCHRERLGQHSNCQNSEPH